MDNSFEWRRYLYYFLIGLISLIACVFLPMLGSEVGLGFNVPNTTAGWVVYIVTKLLVATINMMIFYCFMEQAKLNVKEHPHFIEANQILHKIKDKVKIPLSPQAWNKKQYSVKGITVAITSLLAAFALTNAILSFDLAEMLTYVFTIIMGLVFGVLNMKSAEVYWIDEYYEYALMRQRDEEEKQKEAQSMEMVKSESNQQGNDLVHISGRTDILESSMGNSVVSSNNQSMVLDSDKCNNNVLGGTLYSGSSVANSTNNGVKETAQENKIEEIKKQ